MPAPVAVVVETRMRIGDGKVIARNTNAFATFDDYTLRVVPIIGHARCIPYRRGRCWRRARRSGNRHRFFAGLAIVLGLLAVLPVAAIVKSRLPSAPVKPGCISLPPYCPLRGRHAGAGRSRRHWRRHRRHGARWLVASRSTGSASSRGRCCRRNAVA